ncbi:AI-2E family transporter [Marinomonas sp. 2405UD68-3]|uniref:AI-2E family transporter n=1 Tax=Marinomonas sp. 2405UD68-3 TaxID=3391835 RepID=UPI0039C9A630
MLKIVDSLVRRYFSDEEAVIFLLLLIGIIGGLFFLGNILAPVLIAIVLAFLLQGIVEKLKKIGISHIFSVSLVFFSFLIACGVFIGLMVPIIWQQSVRLVNDVPRMLVELQELLRLLSEGANPIISQGSIDDVLNDLASELTNVGQWLLSFSLSSIPSLFSIIIYAVLVPLVMFFLMKDQAKIMLWCTGWLPKERSMMENIAQEMNDQIANYIRGKFIEMFVVGLVTYMVFVVFGLRYAELLALLVGLSVLIPYIGAAAVTIPVVLVAFYQFGINDNHFIYVVVAYLVVQALDGNVLVPLLFSEAVNLHPLAIIVAVLFFGGIWGFWGVFFAIPLATLVKAILNAWPKESLAELPRL